LKNVISQQAIIQWDWKAYDIFPC